MESYEGNIESKDDRIKIFEDKNEIIVGRIQSD